MTELASAREKGKMSSFLLILCTDDTEIEKEGVTSTQKLLNYIDITRLLKVLSSHLRGGSWVVSFDRPYIPLHFRNFFNFF